jgi:acyl-CoA dehydrogenase
MTYLLPLLALLLAGAFAAYHRTSLMTWAILSVAALAAAVLLDANLIATAVAVAVFALVAVPLLHTLPQLSDTEKTALEAGTVGFEGELFSGMPKWKDLLAQPVPELTAAEQAFLDGPAKKCCRMINDWDITHVRADLPPEIWDFLGKQSSSA